MKNILFTFLFLIGCATQQPIEQKPVNVTPKKNLAWGQPAWDETLLSSIDIMVYEKAKDLETFCPKWLSLSLDEKFKTVGEFYVELAKRESDWSPDASSVDVGQKSNPDSWSIGLFQMSVVDQQNYKMPLGYDYAELLKPIPNIKLAVKIMELNISKYSLIVLPRGRAYWAPLMENGKYNQVKEIAKAVQALNPKCR